MTLSAYQIAPPVSHYFAEDSWARQLTTYADTLELRDNGIDPPVAPSLYHSELNAAATWSDQSRDQLHQISTTYDPAVVSLHLSNRYQDAVVEDGRFVGEGDPYSRDQLRENVATNIATVRDVFDDVSDDVSVLVENNNHLGTDAYDVVTDPAFITAVVRETDCGLLLDIAHAVITAHNTDRSVADYFDALPLDRCRQLHLSRSDLAGELAVDAHAYLRGDDWDQATRLAERLPALEYVTLEYYADPVVLLDQLQYLGTEIRDYVLEREQWDSEFFGREIASLIATAPGEELFSYARTLARERQFDCVYFITDDSTSTRLAPEYGFERVGTRVTFERDTPVDASTGGTGAAISAWQADDLPGLREIARSIFEGTRFYQDERFPESDCDRLYATWIENASRGYADTVLVSRTDGEPTGFISCNCDGDQGTIGLVGVADGAAGSGIGTALVERALACFTAQGIETVRVSTQETNTPAQRLYRSCGFTRVNEQSVFHQWVDGYS